MNLLNENSNDYVINNKCPKIVFEIIAIMLTSSLSACNCFISEKGGKMFILWNQNHDMKSKGADERKDAPGGVLSYFVSTVKKIHYPSVSLQNGRKRTTLFKNNL